MVKQRRTRPDFRREATRLALIEAAERMISEFGVDNVSARQIGAAIGSANNTVVAYHFTSKDGLIEAIFRYREEELDKRRNDLLRAAEAAGTTGDIIEMLRVLCLPLFEQTDTQGRHSYARFLSSVFHTRQGDIRNLVSADAPVTSRLVGMIVELLPESVAIQYGLRWAIVMQMILDALAHIDWQLPNDRSEALHWFEETIVMAAAALTAIRPVRPAQAGLSG